ncbi:MAG TPA: SRPBCC family protein [Acidobacteriaceae bacterium]|jgi:uncharacterized protein YndB with AHSA1/START domain|nr:SRPBCC family protein [Acidobacteriaceae bacterium]
MPLSSPVAERTLLLTRVFNAPRSLVFAAWTDPKRLAQWWGPTGFTNPVCELDLKPYGEIRIDMRAPNGTVYPMAGAYREIVAPERLVFTAAALDANGKPLFENLNTVTFAEYDGNKTLITVDVRVLWEGPEGAPYVNGMVEGWSRSMDRLSEYILAGTGFLPDPVQNDNRELLATRNFRAPLPLVYRMWTEAEHVVQWWGPRGFTNTIEKMDVRPGGEWLLVMHGPDGRDFPNHYLYEEVVPNQRLVINHVNWPQHRKYITFTQSESETKVSIRMLFDSAADLQKVIVEYGAAKGLEENLDKLQQHLDQL